MDLARLTLNDADKTRYTDSDLLSHTRSTIDEVYMLRPDLWFGQYITFAGSQALTALSNIPVDDRFLRTIADGVIFRAESADADHVQSARSIAFSQFMERRLVGR